MATSSEYDYNCHMELKRRIAIGKETFSKRKELLRGNLDRNQQKRKIKASAMECHAVCITDMSYEKRRYKRSEALKCEYGEEWRKSAGLNILYITN